MLRHLAALVLVACAATPSHASCRSDDRSTFSIVTAATFNCRPGVNFRQIDGLVLQGFHLEFLNGDHKPQTLGVVFSSGRTLVARLLDRGSRLTGRLNAATRIRGVLADPDGNDPVRLRLKGLPFRGLRTGSVSRSDCSGDCLIPIPVARPPGTSLALRGFLFARDAEFDDNIRAIRITPTCSGDGTAPFQCFYRVAYRDNDTRETYRILIDFVFVPDRRIDILTFGRPGELATSGNLTGLSPQGDATGTTNDQVLLGFSFRFNDTDHHLREIAVMPDAARSVAVRFNDNATPRITGEVMFATVSPRELLLR